jgi:hypothetical protein
MGFMDKAREAADDLRSSFTGNEARDSESHYRDLGMIAYLTATGRPIDEADRQRLINGLWAIEQGGKLPAFRLVTPPPPPPPPMPAAPPVPAAPPAPAAPAAPAEPAAAPTPPDPPADPPAGPPADPPANEERPPTP